jgi:hypothetical protein
MDGREESMAHWQRQLGAVASLWLLSLGSLPSHAATPAATDPSPELLAAYRVLDRLMAPASIEAPITLVVRAFRGAACPPPPVADPVARTQAAAATQQSSASPVCLSGFEMPTRLRQGFFVPFVASLQRQVDPESDPKRPSAAIEGRTILLNASGLELVRQGSAPGRRQGGEAAPALPPEATCRIAQEFAAVQLGQPRQRGESFDRIHTLLAKRISTVAGLAHPHPSSLEKMVAGILMISSPVQKAVDTAWKIPARNLGHWINARLAESPHWQVLQRHAPAVATALKELRGIPEGNPYDWGPSLTMGQAWGEIDGWLGVAAQERDEVIEEQRKQAQAEAVRLMVAAGIDPRSCAAVFLQDSAAELDAAVLKAYEQARRKALGSGPSLPCRFLPAEQKVLIFPKTALPANGSTGAGSQTGPPGTKR